ncbi:histidine phosphatase family protein [Spongiibacter sp.]|uniref:histidine phosphatase family protein n=1 Tax=Spongiibacter sp. TaxID=2024860 RepID=UPI0035669B7D
MSEVYIVRHGQAAFGTDDYDRLTELGWEQSRLLGEYCQARELHFDAVYTGSMRRHRETLAGLRDVLMTTPNAEELAGLNEYDFHSMVEAYLPTLDEELDLNDARDFYRLLRRALLAWSRDEIPGVKESWAQFEARVRGTMASIAAQSGRVLVVTSGGASSAILREVLGLSVEKMIEINLQARNTGISQYFCKSGAFQLNSFNAVPHLEQPQDRHLITYT